MPVPSTLTSARFWRSVIALVLAAAAAIASGLAGNRFSEWSIHGPTTLQLIAAGGALAFCLLAILATIGFSRIARDLLEPRAGTAHAAVVRYTIVLAGGLANVIITLELFKVPVGNLLVGTAFTAVLLGIAAQQTLGNLFAGVMLMLARPFNVGDQVRMRGGTLGGEIQGTVTAVGITYTRLDTAEGPLNVPNAQAMAAVVGPMQPDGPTDPGPAADPVAAPAGAGPGAAGPVTAATATAAAVTSPGAGTAPPAGTVLPGGSRPPPPGPGDGTSHGAKP
jgi:small-conductance mechanosensitive channel